MATRPVHQADGIAGASNRPGARPAGGAAEIARSDEADRSRPRAAGGIATRPVLAIAAPVFLALLAGILYFWNLVANGMANDYYAAAVYSMSLSWKAFFYAAIDPAGFITVDKPPLAFWVMALSARLFGFSSLSMLAPVALEGVGVVLAIYFIVRRYFGTLAAFIAGLVVALTPITVAITRDNMPDTLLVLLMVLGAWAMLSAMHSGKVLPAVLSAVLIGLAFNTKMLQAYIVLPGFVFAYLVSARASLRRKIGVLSVFGVVLLVVSASWMVIVDSVPLGVRPYIGGSTDGTVLNLILAYNGFGRILGESSTLSLSSGLTSGFGGGGANFGGAAGLLRLFNQEIATQISWLLPLSALALVLGLVSRGLKPLGDQKRGFFLLWGGWLVVHAVVFSFAQGTLHPYYTTAMAPGMAALIGASLAIAWSWYRSGSFLASLALPATIVLGAIWPWELVSSFTWGSPWLADGIVLGTAVAVVGLVGARLLSRGSGKRLSRYLAGPALAFGIGALLLAPGAWSAATLSAQLQGTFPTGGPANVTSSLNIGGSSGFGGRGFPGRDGGRGGFAPSGTAPSAPSGAPGGFSTGGQAPSGFGGGGMGGSVSQSLIDYLIANQDGATYLVAVDGSNGAAPIILATGKPVAAMGGFTGSDPWPTVAELQKLVSSGQLRYVLLGGQGGFRGGFGGTSSVSSWVTSNCSVVDSSAYGGSSNGQTLYVCAPSTASSAG